MVAVGVGVGSCPGNGDAVVDGVSVSVVGGSGPNPSGSTTVVEVVGDVGVVVVGLVVVVVVVGGVVVVYVGSLGRRTLVRGTHV